MLEWMLTPRHWSPRQGYATGDVLMELIDQGWQVSGWRAAEDQTRAPMYFVTLAHGDDTLTLLVLDGPAVRDVISYATV
jgi:hypothetical protein